jgi:hypothetical protein|tara:strand:+ start:2412 stop:2777 length:366 start_codon:yes stop_codon:yes gene_type:complete
MTEDLNLERFNSKSEFCGLHLIALRSELDLGTKQLQNAMNEMDEIPDAVRKSTESLILTLQLSILALSQIEGERNLTCQNTILEKRAHQLTLLQLQEAESSNNKLTQEGLHLRKSLEKFMR